MKKPVNASAFRPTPLASQIAEIRGVFLFERRKAGEAFNAYSPPGHLLHLVVEGEVVQHCNGRRYRLRRGDMLWYHESELVEGVCVRAPWRFYSVVFHAPGLPPPDFSERLTRAPSVGPLFRNLYRAWHNGEESELRRSLLCHAALNGILSANRIARLAPPRHAPSHWLGQLWWTIEGQVRQNLGRAYTLEELAAIGHTSPATVHRASLAAVRLPPVRRIKRLRLEMARGLLIYSKASITEIAEKTGYERINELSRDIRKTFGVTPSSLRRTEST